MDIHNFTMNHECPWCKIIIGPSYRFCNSGHLVCPHCNSHFDETDYITDKLRQCGSDKTDVHNCKFNCGFRENQKKIRKHESSCQNKPLDPLVLNDSNNDVSKEGRVPSPDEGVSVDFDINHNNTKDCFIKSNTSSICEPRVCKFRDTGCSVSSSPIKIRAHHLSCVYRPIRCCYHNCEWTGLFKNIAEHTKMEHLGDEIRAELAHRPMTASRHY